MRRRASNVGTTSPTTVLTLSRYYRLSKVTINHISIRNVSTILNVYIHSTIAEHNCWGGRGKT